LASTRESVGQNDGLRASLLDGWQQVMLGNLHREVIVALFNTEVPGIAAASADDRDGGTGGLEETLIGAESEDRRVMTMGLSDEGVAC
jgi:hypothetical protein